MSISEKAVAAASRAMAEHGYDFPLPVDGDLDDEERGRYDALCAALTAALSLHDAPVERLKRALQKIADLVDSEADEPLDDAIAIANKALIAEERRDV